MRSQNICTFYQFIFSVLSTYTVSVAFGSYQGWLVASVRLDNSLIEAWANIEEKSIRWLSNCLPWLLGVKEFWMSGN
jgi:hypothetical protein